jgi:hypothetical protein
MAVLVQDGGSHQVPGNRDFLYEVKYDYCKVNVAVSRLMSCLGISNWWGV